MLPLLLLATVQAAELAPVAADPAAYDGQVLVILSSQLQPGAQPAGLVVAAGLRGAAPARLDSSAYKNLMPCYEIVIAGAFADTSDARALSKALKAAGVDHYLKPAGAYVGVHPSIQAACQARRQPPAASELVGFVDDLGVRLPLDPAVEERVLDGLGAVQPINDFFDAWRTRLPAQTLDRWTVGQQLVGIDYELGTEACTIQHFDAGVTGQPHWGTLQQGPPQAPSCGELAPYAVLDCQVDLVLLGSAQPVVGQWTGPEAPLATPPPLPDAWQAVVDPVVSLAEQTHEPVQQQWIARPLTWQGRPGRLLSLTVQTGQGEWWCGGEDFHTQLSGVLLDDGSALTPLDDTTGWRVLGVVAPTGGSPSLHLSELFSGSQALQGGAVQAQLPRAYCDCPC